MKKIDTTLNEICNYLKNKNISLSSKNEDGRINSILNEDEILNKIELKFKIQRSEARDWADFFINKIPVNIKITTTKTADNASSKKGLYYALTGKIYYGNAWEDYLKSLSENIKDTDKDYYFLVINKNDTKDIFFNSLKCITKLNPSGNNLPFQIKWNENKKPVEKRSFQESKKIILSTLGKSLQLRAEAYLSFQKYFKDFLDKSN